MKCNVKGLVFVGFAAAILSAGAAQATDDNAKIVTSKAFTEATYQAKTAANKSGQVLKMKSNTAGDIDYIAVDTTVTANSDNLVTSGAVSTAIANQGLGSTYEVLSNKLDDTDNKTIATNGDSTTLYPSAKAVKTYADSKVSSASSVGTSTTVAPNEKAVSDALALKQAASTAVKYGGTQAVGSATQPVYVDANGAVTALTYTIQKSVPADAVFTDTTYNAMTGATDLAAGASGLVPAPAAGDNTKFLNGAGQWATPENTTYDTLTAEQVTTGTDITGKLVTAKILRDELDAKQNASTAVTFDGTNATGSATQPVYIAQDGTATATTYSLGMSVPAAATGADAATKVLNAQGNWVTPDWNAAANAAGYIANKPSVEVTGNKVTTITSGATDTQYPSAAAVYSYVTGLPSNGYPALPTGADACTDAAPCALVATTNGAAWVKMSQPSAQ